MSLRLRPTGEILCAAMHPEQPGDQYVDDQKHYELSVDHGLLVTEPMELPVGVGLGGHGVHGRWWWRGEAPSAAVLEARP
jgi:hypothetical protein